MLTYKTTLEATKAKFHFPVGSKCKIIETGYTYEIVERDIEVTSMSDILPIFMIAKSIVVIDGLKKS